MMTIKNGNKLQSKLIIQIVGLQIMISLLKLYKMKYKGGSLNSSINFMGSTNKMSINGDNLKASKLILNKQFKLYLSQSRSKLSRQL